MGKFLTLRGKPIEMTDFEKTTFVNLKTEKALKKVGFGGGAAVPAFLQTRKWLREHPLKIDINVVWLAGRFDAIVNFYPKPHFAPGYTTPVQHARINGIETEPEAWNTAILEAVKLIKKMAK